MRLSRGRGWLSHPRSCGTKGAAGLADCKDPSLRWHPRSSEAEDAAGLAAGKGPSPRWHPRSSEAKDAAVVVGKFESSLSMLAAWSDPSSIQLPAAVSRSSLRRCRRLDAKPREADTPVDSDVAKVSGSPIARGRLRGGVSLVILFSNAAAHHRRRSAV